MGIGTVLFYDYLTPVDVDLFPSLTLNYPNGQVGSIFTITGWDFPPDTQTTLSINLQVLTPTVVVNPTGSFILFLDTTGAETGYYVVTASGDQSTSTGFFLTDSAPLRPQEGGGQTFIVPPGLAYQNSVFMPLVVFLTIK